MYLYLTMAELKTKPTDKNVEAFIDQIEPEWKRDDCHELLKMMKKITGEVPVMWGDSIVGFGNYHYKYKTGREGDWFLTGFSPRKQSMTVYVMGGFEKVEDLLPKLGKHKVSVGCLYFKKLSELDIQILEKLIVNNVETLKMQYST